MISLEYRLDHRNVPVISDYEIDVGAERLLRDFNCRLLTDPQPIDIESFAEDYLGLHIHYDNLSHNGCIWGTMIYLNSLVPIYDPITKRAEYTAIDANTIVIDNCIAEGSKEEIFRSTLGHECGHGVYHREYFERRQKHPDLYQDDKYGVSFAACRKADIIGIGIKGRHRLTTERDFIEHHAKRFSAALLMPTRAMRIICHDRDFRALAQGEAADLSNEILAEQVAEVFKVSSASALIRIKQLRLGFKNFSTNPAHV